jgi:hypothetical protein
MQWCYCNMRNSVWYISFERYWNSITFFIYLYIRPIISCLKIKILSSALRLIELRDRWFYSCALCDRWFYSCARFMTDGSTVVHPVWSWFYRCSLVWPMVLQMCTAYDRWFYSCAPCMIMVLQLCTCVTDGTTVVHGLWPVVLQLCTVHKISSVILIRFLYWFKWCVTWLNSCV